MTRQTRRERLKHGASPSLKIPPGAKVTEQSEVKEDDENKKPN